MKKWTKIKDSLGTTKSNEYDAVVDVNKRCCDSTHLAFELYDTCAISKNKTKKKCFYKFLKCSLNLQTDKLSISLKSIKINKKKIDVTDDEHATQVVYLCSMHMCECPCY